MEGLTAGLHGSEARGAGARALRTALPALALALLVLVVWRRYGVGGRDSLRYLGYELVFVVAPGWTLVRALSPAGGALRRLVLGWTAGYALEVFAFALTAALGVRGLFVAYPPLVVAGSLALAAFAPVRPGADVAARAVRVTAGWLWAVCGVAAFCVLGFVAGLYKRTPLPGTVGQVTYHHDLVVFLAYAAEARHHWPMQYPLVSGERFPYHTFAFMHMAAADQVTHVGLPLILFRLFDPSIAVLLTLQLAYLGTVLARRTWAGPLVALVALVAGELDLDARLGVRAGVVPFLGGFPIDTWLSPSFEFGTVFLVGALILLVEHLRGPTLRHVVLLALVLACAGGAKVTILPLLGGGLLVLAAVELVVRRRVGRPTLGALALVAGIGVVFLLTLYRGQQSGFTLSPWTELKKTYVLLLFEPTGASTPVHDAYWIVGLGVAAVGLFCAGLVGLVGVPRRRLVRPGPEVLLLGVFLVGLIPLALLGGPANDQTYFAFDGWLALAAVGGAGLYRLLAGVLRTRTDRLRAAGLAAGWCCLLAVVALVAAFVVDLGSRALYLVLYGILVAGLALAAFAVRRRGRGAVLATVAAGVVTACLLNVPLDVVPGIVSAHRHGTPEYDTAGAMTLDLWRGYVWLRDHTSPRDVLAVDSYAVVPAGKPADNFYVGAFAERRVFLEGWVYAPRSRTLGKAVWYGTAMPFPDRLRLNEAVFRRGDRSALRVLTSRYGVRYLVVDRVHGGVAPGPARLGREVYSNPALAVYAVS